MGRDNSVDMLLMLAQQGREQEQATNPLYGLANGIQYGMQQELDAIQKRKQLEDTYTTFAKMKKLFGGSEYDLTPELDTKSGSMNLKLVQRDDRELFNDAVNQGTSATELYSRFPSYSKAVDNLIQAGVVANPFQGQGTPIPGMPSTSISPVGGFNEQAPAITEPAPGYITVPKVDALGRPAGQDIVKDLRPEIEAKQQAERVQVETARSQAEGILKTVDRLKKDIKYFGPMGNIDPLWIQTGKANWLANYNSLKDKMVVDLIMQMKEASKTGATGLGNMSEKEGMRLENAKTALQRGLDPYDAMEYLIEIEEATKNVLKNTQRTGNVGMPTVGGMFNGERILSVEVE